MNFALNVMNFALKTKEFVLKMMNILEGLHGGLPRRRKFRHRPALGCQHQRRWAPLACRRGRGRGRWEGAGGGDDVLRPGGVRLVSKNHEFVL